MKLLSRLVLGAATLFTFVAVDAFAAPTADATFGGTGIVTGYPGVDPSLNSTAHEGLAVDRRGGILFMETTGDFTQTLTAIRRLKGDGTFDDTFGGPGPYSESGLYLVWYPHAYNPATSLTIDSLDRVVSAILPAAGATAYISVWRHSEDGYRDPTFGRIGSVPGFTDLAVEDPYPILEVRAQSDGKVLVVTSSHAPGTPAGNRSITLFRLNEDGSPDVVFGAGGVVYTSVPGGVGQDQGTGVAVQPDGRIVVAGRSQRLGGEYDAVAVRYLGNGMLDPGFGVAGIRRMPYGLDRALGRKVTLQADGRIVVSGTLQNLAGTTGQPTFFRLNVVGFPDFTFGTGAMAYGSLGQYGGALYQHVQQPADGRIVSVGYRYRAAGGNVIAAVLRNRLDGSIDTTWDFDGVVDLPVPGYAETYGASIANYDAARIVVSGIARNGTSSRWFIARAWTGP